MHTTLKELLQKLSQAQYLDKLVTDSAQRDVDSIRDAYSYLYGFN